MAAKEEVVAAAKATRRMKEIAEIAGFMFRFGFFAIYVL